jgi:biotin carboxylase
MSRSNGVRRPVIVVGFVPPLRSRDDFAAGTLILLDEPDVIRKRGIEAIMADAPALRELAGVEYQRPGAADAFVNARPDLRPALVVPLVEYATPFAARLAERYGLPGAGLGAAEILRDKAALRTVTRAAGIANPEFAAVGDAGEVRRFMAGRPGPVVLKPANRQASVGTKIVSDPGAAESAWADCRVQDEGDQVPDRSVPLRMLVEQYVSGAEYSVEMLVRDGVPLFANITGKALYAGPRPIELGHVVPADLPEDTAGLLRRRTADVLRAVGFGTGIVHCEWILSDTGPYLVECAGRFPGDGIAELIERAYPVELATHYYALMRGEAPPPLPHRARGAAAVRFLDIEPGRIKAVDGLAEAAAMPGVVHASVTAAPGDTVPPLRSSWDRIGSVMACADTPAEATARAVAAARRIRVAVAPT